MQSAWRDWTQTRSGLAVPEAKSLAPSPQFVRLQSKSDAPDWSDQRGREWKVSAGSAVLDSDEESGTLTTLASVTGIVDRVDDIIVPGAYALTLAARTPKVIKDHDWTQKVGKCLQIAELPPGDSRLPDTLPDGSPWPSVAGALVAKVLYNMATQIGREAFAEAVFYGPDQEWSIGYNATQAQRSQQDGIRRIKVLDLYELSMVLWGAMPWARTTEIGATA